MRLATSEARQLFGTVVEGRLDFPIVPNPLLAGGPSGDSLYVLVKLVSMSMLSPVLSSDSCTVDSAGSTRNSVWVPGPRIARRGLHLDRSDAGRD